ncbi:MAG: lycopene cyclase family protein [Burkholderiales bacterium]|nr:lycopene cyclase family protein [Burkholderiales bacterium]
MQTEFDLIVIGAGCAGLSLGTRLASLHAQAPKTLLLESRVAYDNDRTWCFWGDAQTPFATLARHSWQRFSVKQGLHSTLIDCAPTPYRMLSAADFYAKAIDAITSNAALTLQMGASLTAEPSFSNGTWLLHTTVGSFSAKAIVDTRPLPIEQMSDTTLWQSFLGCELEFEEPRFDSKSAQLMDFYQANQAFVGFVYVLPVSTTRALVEFTVFAPRIFEHAELLGYLESQVVKLAQERPYKTQRTEYGLIPMGLGRPVHPAQDTASPPSYVRVGLTAGAARPATGYAFQRIQRWASACAQSLQTTGIPVGHPQDSFAIRQMDAIFLNVLRHHPELGPELFMRLFSKVDSTKLIRFLSDRGSVSDYLAVILALPSGLFLKSAYQLATKK